MGKHQTFSADSRLDTLERTGAGLFTDVLLAHAAAHPPAQRQDPWGVRLLPRITFGAPVKPAHGLSPADPGVAVLHHPQPGGAGGRRSSSSSRCAEVQGCWTWLCAMPRLCASPGLCGVLIHAAATWFLPLRPCRCLLHQPLMCASLLCSSWPQLVQDVTSEVARRWRNEKPADAWETEIKVRPAAVQSSGWDSMPARLLVVLPCRLRVLLTHLRLAAHSLAVSLLATAHIDMLCCFRDPMGAGDGRAGCSPAAVPRVCGL